MKIAFLESSKSRRDGSYPAPLLPADLPPLENLFEDITRPLEVEIGCGKGKFILARAAENPGINFLGVDYAKKWMSVGVRRGEKRKLSNVRFIRANAWQVIKEYLPQGSVSGFHIYFPDPWPKKRHRKRRLLTPDFLEALRRVICRGGFLEIAMDQEDYFEEVREYVREYGSRWTDIKESRNRRLFCDHLKTNYEIKYEAAGRPLFYLELVR